MTQIGEGAFMAPLPSEEEKEKEKKPRKIRIALFFDGTLNNRTNIEARELELDAYRKYRRSGNSFENGRTNIAIMEGQVKDEAEGYDFFAKAYIEGPGTLNLKGDSFLGYAFAIGKSGVPKRAKLGVTRAVNEILGFDDFDKEENYIEKLSFDVFGFSRGAATARYAIHLILKHKTKAVYNQLQNFGYTIEESAVEVSFAGLYDTVLSYMASQKLKSANNVLKQKAISLAKKSLHLASAEEHRKDFPLHNINSAKAAGGEEYFLPGVHSDVGGSYNRANEKKIASSEAAGKPTSTIEYMTTNDEEMIINKGTQTELAQDRQYLIQQGWYKESEISIEEVRVPRAAGGKRHRNTSHHILTVSRSGIKSAYSNIPLKIMAFFARGNDVKLKIDCKLEDRADKILSKEPDLLSLEIKIKNYVFSKTNSKPEDWLNDSTLKNIRHKHFNFSAKCKIGYAPRISKNIRKRFIYDA